MITYHRPNKAVLRRPLEPNLRPAVGVKHRTAVEVEARAGDAKVALAFEGGSITAANFIVRTDASVIGMGGSYVGLEDNPSIDQLAQWQRTGDLGFVYGFSPDSGEDASGPLITDGASERATWVKQNCTVVPASTYGGAEAKDVPQLPNFLGGSANTLYNCIK